MFDEWLIDSPELAKSLVPEDLDYYVTFLIWLRILGLKAKNKDPMTATEREILEMYESTPHNVPEPLRLYLLTYGNIVTGLGTHLYPQFPVLPTSVINWPDPQVEVPGFYGDGPADADTHNLYEEVPCLGMALAACVQAQLGGQPR